MSHMPAYYSIRLWSDVESLSYLRTLFLFRAITAEFKAHNYIRINDIHTRNLRVPLIRQDRAWKFISHYQYYEMRGSLLSYFCARMTLTLSVKLAFTTRLTSRLGNRHCDFLITLDCGTSNLIICSCRDISGHTKRDDDLEYELRTRFHHRSAVFASFCQRSKSYSNRRLFLLT